MVLSFLPAPMHKCHSGGKLSRHEGNDTCLIRNDEGKLLDAVAGRRRLAE